MQITMSRFATNTLGYMGGSKKFTSVEAEEISAVSGAGLDLLLSGNQKSVVITSGENVADAIAIVASGALANIQLQSPTEVLNQNVLRRSSGRYYLEEFFMSLPFSGTLLLGQNQNFDMVGDGAVADSDATYGTSPHPGFTLHTQFGVGTGTVIRPVPAAGTHASSWTENQWGTENSLEWECCVIPLDIVAVTIWAGLVTTASQDSEDITDATAADAIFFRFEDTVDAFWHVESSVGGVPASTTATTVTALVNTLARFRITFGSDRIARGYINDTLVVTAPVFDDDTDLVPVIGVQGGGGGASSTSVRIAYQKLSRVIAS